MSRFKYSFLWVESKHDMARGSTVVSWPVVG